MSWSDNLELDNVARNNFVRLTCRIKVLDSAFSNVTGNIYSANFTHGPVHTFELNGSAFTLGTSSTVTAGQFYYDRTTQTLYIYHVGAPSASDFHCAHFYLFSATTECVWFEDPSDDTTATVYWPGTLVAPPSFRVTIPPLAMGLFPVEPSGMTLSNEGTLNYVIGNGSFYRTSCELWEQIGELDVDNFAKKLSAIVGRGVAVNDATITFDIVDKILNFDARVNTGSYYPAGNVDPKFQYTPGMKVWGYGADVSYQMVDVDYNATAPTTSNNRKFGLFYDTAGDYAGITVAGSLDGTSGQFDCTVPGNMNKFKAGDLVWFDGATDKYLEVDSVGPFAGRVFMTTIPGSGTQAGNLLKTLFQGVFIVKDNNLAYQLKYGRDFTETLHPGNFRGITLRSTAEANAGCATFDPNSDSIWCYPEGKRTFPTFSAAAVTEISDYTGGFTNGINVLYDFLKSECDLAESEIDYDSFTEAASVVYWDIFVPVPLSNTTDYPTRREILNLMLSSLMLRAYFNADGQFAIKPYVFSTSTEGTISKEEIGSYEYNIDYSEITAVQFGYAWAIDNQNYLGTSGTKEETLAGTASLKLLTTSPVAQIINATGSDEATYLHKSEKSILIPYCVVGEFSNFFISRMRDLYGERSGIMKIVGKKIALDKNPSDDLTIYRDSIVGLVDATGNNADFEILEIDKSYDNVELGLNDKKAANDKSDEDYWALL